MPNSNVLIEYGWALKSRGHGCIVPVMNTAFGKPSWETLPFNMRHLRWPLTYELKQEESQQRRSQVREELVKALCTDIRAILRDQSLTTPGETETFQETMPTYDKAVFFNEGESLAKWEGHLGAMYDLHL